MFANLTQFVDSPKHYGKAQHCSGLVCALRAIELSVALSLVVAAWLVEEPEPRHGQRLMAHLVSSLQELRESRAWPSSWLLCILVHYICMVIRWCSCWSPSSSLVVPRCEIHHRFIIDLS